MIKEEETFRQMQINDVADMKAQVRYDCTMGEGVKQATSLSCDKTTTNDEVENTTTTNAGLRVDKGFGTFSE